MQHFSLKEYWIEIVGMVLREDCNEKEGTDAWKES